MVGRRRPRLESLLFAFAVFIFCLSNPTLSTTTQVSALNVSTTQLNQYRNVSHFPTNNNVTRSLRTLVFLNGSIADDPDIDICSELNNFPNACELAKEYCRGDSIIPYHSLYYCHFQSLKPLYGILVLLLIIVFFQLLSHVSDEYLTSALQTIANYFNLSDEVSGVLLLSFANGAPDFFTSLVSSQQKGGFDLVLGNVVGSGLFISNIVLGSVIIASVSFYTQYGRSFNALKTNQDSETQRIWYKLFPKSYFAFKGYTIRPWSYYRNVVVYTLAIVSVFLIFVDGKVRLWQAILFIVCYFLFIFSILAHRAVVKRKRKRALKKLMRAHRRKQQEGTDIPSSHVKHDEGLKSIERDPKRWSTSTVGTADYSNPFDAHVASGVAATTNSAKSYFSALYNVVVCDTIDKVRKLDVWGKIWYVVTFVNVYSTKVTIPPQLSQLLDEDDDIEDGEEGDECDEAVNEAQNMNAAETPLYDSVNLTTPMSALPPAQLPKFKFTQHDSTTDSSSLDDASILHPRTPTPPSAAIDSSNAKSTKRTTQFRLKLDTLKRDNSTNSKKTHDKIATQIAASRMPKFSKAYLNFLYCLIKIPVERLLLYPLLMALWPICNSVFMIFSLQLTTPTLFIVIASSVLLSIVLFLLTRRIVYVATSLRKLFELRPIDEQDLRECNFPSENMTTASEHGSTISQNGRDQTQLSTQELGVRDIRRFLIWLAVKPGAVDSTLSITTAEDVYATPTSSNPIMKTPISPPRRQDSLKPIPGVDDEEMFARPIPVTKAGIWETKRRLAKRLFVEHSHTLSRFYYLDFFAAFVAFVTCILWIYAAAKEIVGILTIVAQILRIDRGMVGVTLLAWGNSIGDLFADMALAKSGQFFTALTAVFTGPIQNIFLTIGVTFLIITVENGGNAVILPKIPPNVYLVFIFLLIGLFLFCIILPLFLFRLRMPFSLGVSMLAYYMIFLVVIIIAQLTHGFGMGRMFGSEW